MKFQLPDLPFSMDALEPHMSAETLKLHHGKHHKAYVDKLNKAIEGTPYAELSLEEIIQRSFKKDPGVFNNAGQHWNHTFFWQCLKSGGGTPKGDLLKRIEKDFGDLAGFRKEFSKAAEGLFGSGWTWLVLDADKLKITTTPNGETPLLHDQHALLTLDVWEHAYYVDYRNERPKFITAFLDSLINWDFAAERLTHKGEEVEPARKRRVG
ncbi:MAG TPA: superoxide dismutase [Dongiaceae bacterium]|nr:superoxide dismutase [Dongiaceae bacterium]